MLQALTRISPTTLAKVVAQNALLAVAYFVVARVSLLFAYRDLQITAVWLPSGMAMAAVLMLGARVVPGILLGDFATGLTFGTAPAGAAVVAAGGALEAVVGARLLPQPATVRLQPLFGVPQVMRFVVRGAVLAPLASTLLGVGALLVGGTIAGAELPRAIAVWWTGDCIGILLVMPMVLLILIRGRPPAMRRAGDLALLFLTIGGTAIIFFSPGLAHTSGNALGFLVFPLIAWCAFSFSASLLAATNLLIAIAALTGTSMGLGPYALSKSMSDIWYLQAYVAAIATMSLMLRGAIEDQRRSTRRADQIEGHFLAATDAGSHLVLILQRPEGEVASSDAPLRITFANRTARATFAAPARAQTAPLLAEALPMLMLPQWQECFDQALDQRTPSECEARLDDPGGTQRSYRCVVIPLEQGLMLTMVDITEEKAAQLQAQAAERSRLQAEASARSKAMMLSYFAHEVGNPLNGVLGMAEIMRTDEAHPLPEAQQRRLSLVIAASEHIRDVMRDVLDLQRLEAGRFEIHPVSIDARPAVGRATEQCRPDAQSAGIRLSLRESVETTVYADPTRLHQCLLNLLSNAIKYNHNG